MDAYAYLAQIPSGEIKPVYPDARQAEIENTKNEKVKREKYYVWRLLEYAISDIYGKSITELEFTKLESGRWSTPFCEFSLSHTDGVVAVAISQAPVGIDVELLKPSVSEKTAARIMSDGEYGKYQTLTSPEKERFFFEVWTKKEAIFKSLHQQNFIPSHDYSDNKILTKTEEIVLTNSTVTLTVAVNSNESEMISTMPKILTKSVDIVNNV